jgi:hypothetical protein
MPRPDKAKIKALQHDLKRKKVFTLDQLVSQLRCSIPTARLNLKRWGAYTSYNQNGRYYALPGVPRFDHNGLWCFEGICFSRNGNLKGTLVYLIQAAPAGLTGKEIGELVRLPPRSFLYHFRDVPGIKREKIAGVYVYFSDMADRYQVQLALRLREVADASEPLRVFEVILVLSALIRHHGITLDEIMALPEIKAAGVSALAVGGFMIREGLQKKMPASGH